MHEEKEQTQFVVGGSDSFFWNFSILFFLEKKTTPRRVHLLVVIEMTLPVSHLDRSELKTDALINAERSASQHSENNKTSHIKKHKKFTKKKKCESPILV